MKKALALLCVCLLLTGVFAGCNPSAATTPAAPTETTVPVSVNIDEFRTITGLDPSLTVLSAEGIELPLSLYCYWQIYHASLMEYQVYTYAESREEFKNLIGTNGYLNWDAPFGDSDTLRAYLNKQTDDTIRQYMAIEILAAENGLALDENDMKTLEAERERIAASLENGKTFEEYIAEMGLSQANFDRINACAVLFDKLLELMKTEGSPLYVSLDELDQYGLFTDHIFLSKIDLSSYNKLSDETITSKRAKAEELIKQITGSDDREATFSALASEYSEDPYRSSYPDGYVFAPGTMNTAYETAAQALMPGQISGVVEGETGFYIILRKDLREKLDADVNEQTTLRRDYLTDRILARAEQIEFTIAPELEKLDVETVYTAYVKLMSGRS